MKAIDKRGHELQYSVYIDEAIFPEEADAVKYLDGIMTELVKMRCAVNDWDGPL